MDYYSTPKNQRNDEVTGISRSGRVRKKPSKLSDFESPDDITEQRIKRQKAQQHAHAQQLLHQFEQRIHQQDQLKNAMQQEDSKEQHNIVEKITLKQTNKPTQQRNAQQPRTPIYTIQKPKVSTQVVQQTKPVQQAKPIQQARPVPQTKPIQQPRPVLQARPIQQARAAQQSSPVQQTKSAQQINDQEPAKPQQQYLNSVGTNVQEPEQISQIQFKQEIKNEVENEVKNEVKNEDDSEESSESETENANGLSENVNEEESGSDSMSDDDDEDEDDDDEENSTAEEEETEIEPTGFTKLEPPGNDDMPVQAKNSLYMQEKYKKKIVIQDGKVINKTMKTQRKDKGKTRFTAYMLWAKEARQNIQESYPNLDFASMSKKLGELWATVPNLEKYNWRKRAKRMAMKPPNAIKDSKMLPPTPRTFINKTPSTNRESSPVKKVIELSAPVIGTKVPESPPSNKGVKDLNEAYLGTGMYKVTGTQPIDVAAHLTLLGESLTIIGKKLKYHEGQITVSGSLPLLLDSLICAVAPLLCLTQQIPEMNGADPETLSSTLENVAYIMPGL